MECFFFPLFLFLHFACHCFGPWCGVSSFSPRSHLCNISKADYVSVQRNFCWKCYTNVPKMIMNSFIQMECLGGDKVMKPYCEYFFSASNGDHKVHNIITMKLILNLARDLLFKTFLILLLDALNCVNPKLIINHFIVILMLPSIQSRFCLLRPHWTAEP